MGCSRLAMKTQRLTSARTCSSVASSKLCNPYESHSDGLAKGNHEITLKVAVRVAYLPVPFEGEATRTVEIGG